MSKYNKNVYYTVLNGGDGSAYPTWTESMDLAEFYQDNIDDEYGWGESCCGILELESDSPIIIKSKVVTKYDYLYENFLNNYNEYLESHALNFLDKFGDEINLDDEINLKFIKTKSGNYTGTEISYKVYDIFLGNVKFPTQYNCFDSELNQKQLEEILNKKLNTLKELLYY